MHFCVGRLVEKRRYMIVLCVYVTNHLLCQRRSLLCHRSIQSGTTESI